MMTTTNPPAKKIKIKNDEEEGGSMGISLNPKHIDSLPAEILGPRIISKLSVLDHLHCEGVSPRWKWITDKFGWTLEKKLGREVVFDGATESQREKFEPEHLISLLHRFVGEQKNNSLVELDLHSFYSISPPFQYYQLRRFVPKIAESIRLFPKLLNLNIKGFDLAHFVNYLPANLRTLEVSETFSCRTLKKLSEKCPNLEEVPFKHVVDVKYKIVNSFLQKFLRQKALYLQGRFLSLIGGNLTAIYELKELEVLELRDCRGLDAKSFEAMSKGCQRLRKLSILETRPLLEASFLHLVNLPNLTVLEIWSSKDGAFTDGVLKAIAQRGKLKKLLARSNNELTDDSILHLIDQCKSLVSLDLTICPKITNLVFDAVLAEVNRRHLGNPPPPTGNAQDPGIFRFVGVNTGIDMDRAHQLTEGNPWIRICSYDFRTLI